jgi:hypothetical protein
MAWVENFQSRHQISGFSPKEEKADCQLARLISKYTLPRRRPIVTVPKLVNEA